MGIDFSIPRQWRQQLKDVGFVDAQQKWFNWPVGPWAKHKKNKLLGRLLLADLYDGLGAIGAVYTSALGWSTDEVHRFIQEAKDDLMAQKSHWYMQATVIYARKPENPD
jgi:hypothetical protein